MVHIAPRIPRAPGCEILLVTSGNFIHALVVNPPQAAVAECSAVGAKGPGVDVFGNPERGVRIPRTMERLVRQGIGPAIEGMDLQLMPEACRRNGDVDAFRVQPLAQIE